MTDVNSDRRALSAELGATLRRAIDELVCTEAPAPELESALQAAHEVLGRLQGFRRPPDQLASLDPLHGARIHSPAAGEGNPIAPPLNVRRTDNGVKAELELGRAYEGPPGYVHGGVTALLLDETLGRAAVEAGRFGMTAVLTLRYRRPIPLRTPILLQAAVSDTQERSTTVTGTVTTQDDPDTTLVEATGLFIQLSQDKRRTYFGGLRHADGASAAGYRLQPSGPDETSQGAPWPTRTP